MNVNDLTMEEKIGQMLMFGVKSYNVDCLCDLIRNSKIGGVILYKNNYNSYDEMIKVINKLKRANSSNRIPLFISIDQEGGKVNRMPSEFLNIKNVFDLSLRGDVSLLERASAITSEMLLSSGVNMNFAPVLDIYNNTNNKVLFKRCFGTDASIVSEYGIAYMKTMNDNGIISVVKHFPGHGLSRVDSHIFLPYVFDYNRVLNKHIIPFENAISNGCDAIMISHLFIRRLTGGMPASISRNFIFEYLRKKYNYNGLVISDDIRMKAVDFLYGKKSLKYAFNSGTDIVLLKYRDGDSNIINIICNLVKDNKVNIENIDSSVERILKLKHKYGINDELSSGCDYSLINNKIISSNIN